jgi:hypothetical protein
MRSATGVGVTDIPDASAYRSMSARTVATAPSSLTASAAAV